jgi:hypothetical protein
MMQTAGGEQTIATTARLWFQGQKAWSTEFEGVARAVHFAEPGCCGELRRPLLGQNPPGRGTSLVGLR